jgi:carbon monoxide dehydrogenase subunit G
VKLSNSFRIDRPVPEVFDAFLDVERVAGCMPGSRLLGRSAEDTYEGEVKVKVGPLGVAYSGQLTLLAVDREQWSMTMRAKGREQRGAGNADALVQAQLRADGTGTLVEITTDLNIRGKVAQFGRGVIGEVTDGIMQTFAANVEQMLAGPSPVAPIGTPRGTATAPSAPSAGSSARTTTADSLDAWSLIVRPLVQRHGRSVGIVLAAGIAAYLGARAGHRRSARG